MLNEALKASAVLPSVWITSASLRAASGYRDNLLLSPFNPVSSPLASLGGDFILSRIPMDGTEVTVLATGDYTYFTDAPEAEPEALALGQAGVKREVGGAWTLGLEGEYVFVHQVFDVSATEAALSTVTAIGNTFTLSPSVSRTLGRGWELMLETDGTRQLFSAPLDDYWEVEPAVSVLKSIGDATEVSLKYVYGRRWYDTREPLDSEGNALPGRLRFDAHELDVRARVFWDDGKRWSTQVRMGFLENTDNGGGYFEFTRYSAGMQVRYRSGRWTFRAEGRAKWYDYAVQRSDGPESALRRKTDVTALLRGEFEASRKLRVFVEYEHESSLDNTPATSYHANNFTAGVEVDL